MQGRYPAAFGRNLDHDFAHQFIMGKNRGVRVSDEVSKRDPPVNFRVLTPDLSLKCHQHRRPVAAGVGFRQRPPDRAAVAHLRLGNAGRAVMNDRDLRGYGRGLDLRVPGQSSETQRAVFFVDIRRARDEIQIQKIARIREAQLHQRYKTLPASQQLGFIAKLGKHGHRFLQRARAVIVKSSGIHASDYPY